VKTARRNSGLILILVILLAAAGTVAAFFSNQERVDVRLKQSLLDEELRAIPLPRDGATFSFDVTHRPTNALAQVTVRGGRSSYDDLVRYFDPILIGHGWRYVSEKKMTDWGRDFGGRSRNYSKGALELTLQYSGRESSYGWTYAISLTSGDGA
jgi:hypothetical protein